MFSNTTRMVALALALTLTSSASIHSLADLDKDDGEDKPKRTLSNIGDQGMGKSIRGFGGQGSSSHLEGKMNETMRERLPTQFSLSLMSSEPEEMTRESVVANGCSTTVTWLGTNRSQVVVSYINATSKIESTTIHIAGTCSASPFDWEAGTIFPVEYSHARQCWVSGDVVGVDVVITRQKGNYTYEIQEITNDFIPAQVTGNTLGNTLGSSQPLNSTPSPDSQPQQPVLSQAEIQRAARLARFA